MQLDRQSLIVKFVYGHPFMKDYDPRRQNVVVFAILFLLAPLGWIMTAIGIAAVIFMTGIVLIIGRPIFFAVIGVGKLFEMIVPGAIRERLRRLWRATSIEFA